MSKKDAERTKKEFEQKREKITTQWAAFKTKNGPDAYADLMEFIDLQRSMFIKYAEDMAMPHPLNAGETVTIPPETAALLLQRGAGLSIVKTYIESQADHVAPTK